MSIAKDFPEKLQNIREKSRCMTQTCRNVNVHYFN